MAWDKHCKPPVDVCPKQYCFLWVPPGGSADLTGRLHNSLAEAIKLWDDSTEFPDGGCRCQFGVCTRLDTVAGDHDWYEPNEPALKRDGLPWFYFIPSTDKLVQECHERYLRESQALWGGRKDDQPGAAPTP